jgi:hypothetical protein
MRTRAVWAVSGVAAAGLLIAVASPGWAQVKAGSEKGLGLTGADVPALLVTVEAAPYQLPAPLDCAVVAGELAGLDELLGLDIDAEPVEIDTKASFTAKGANVARGLIPYGGVVRFVTGAGAKDKALQKAVLAGYARRGFLRGLQALPRCGAGPQMPPPAAAPRKSRR